MVQDAINGCENRHWRSFHCCFVQNQVVSVDNSHVLSLYFDVMADRVITAAVFTCENCKSSIPAVAAAVSDLPPRIGSGPWFVKSRPYRLSPSRIFCRHWAPGASWRTQSLTQGRGELGPGLADQTNKIHVTQNVPAETASWPAAFRFLSHLAPLE